MTFTYLTGVDTATARTSGRPDLAVLGTPDSNAQRSWRHYAGAWAADNGCFAEALGRDWSPERWLAWLRTLATDAARLGACRWAAVPDVVGDHRATLDRWSQYAAAVADLGYRPAFVGQDGATPGELPADAGALFVGGSTEWKCSPDALELVRAAQRRALPVHIGRVNTWQRLAWSAYVARADTADGTMLRHGPETWRRLTRWLDRVNAPALFDIVGAR